MTWFWYQNDQNKILYKIEGHIRHKNVRNYECLQVSNNLENSLRALGVRKFLWNFIVVILVPKPCRLGKIYLKTLQFYQFSVSTVKNRKNVWFFT